MDSNFGLYVAAAALALLFAFQKLRNRKAPAALVGAKIRSGGLADMPR